MDEEKLKQAFANIKQDISKINNDNQTLKESLIETLNHLSNLNSSIEKSLNNIILKQDKLSTQLNKIKTTSTHSSTLRQEVEGSKPQNLAISTGNQGVSTDRQTDTSTDTSTHKGSFNLQSSSPENTNIIPNQYNNPNESIIKQASELIENLDNIKKEVRLKFKRLTNQEMKVFTLLYQLDNQQIDVDYNILAKNLNLTQSSIRDYIQRITAKGIPIDKEKIDNKKIIIHISQDLKKIASIETILKLRDL